MPDYSKFDLTLPPGATGPGAAPPPGGKTLPVTPTPGTGKGTDYSQYDLTPPPNLGTHPSADKWDNPTYVATQVSTIADKVGVPRDIALAQASQESGMRQSAVGYDIKTKKPISYGVMQIVPHDHPTFGDVIGNPENNITQGLKYLKGLYNVYGNWVQALAAYNAGTDAVDKGYWLHAAGYAGTRAYVSKILGPSAISDWQTGPQGKAHHQNIVEQLAGGAGKLTTGPAKAEGKLVLGGAEKAAELVMQHVADQIKEKPGEHYTTAQREAQWSPRTIATTITAELIHGLYGVPVKPAEPVRGTLPPDIAQGYAALPPELKAKWDAKYGKPVAPQLIPENRALGQLAYWGGTTLGMLIGSRWASGASIYVAGKIPAIGSAVDTGMKLLPKATEQYLRLATPFAVGSGGQQAFTEAVNNLFNTGYLHVTKDLESSLGPIIASYLLPGAAVLGAKVMGTTFSLAPLLLRYLPASLGGSGMLIKDVPIGSIVPSGFEAAAKALHSIYEFPSKIPLAKGLQQYLTGFETFGNKMDNFLKYGHVDWQFPSWKYNTWPANSPLDPLDNMRRLDLPRAIVTLGGKIRNIGGGFGGAQFQNPLAKQIRYLSSEMARAWNVRLQATGQTVTGYAGPIVQNLRIAAKTLEDNVGAMESEHWDRVASNLNNALHSTRNARFWNKVPSLSGKDWSMTKEGEYLQQIINWSQEMAHKGGTEEFISGGMKQGTANLVLGLGNVGSATTVMSRIGFALATEREEAVTWGMMQRKNLTQDWTNMQKDLGFKPTITTIQQKGPGAIERIEQLGFSMFDHAEQFTLPVSALSRFYNNMKVPGAVREEAWRDALNYARRLRTSNSYYDLPRPFHGEKWSPIMRAFTQFFPFALKSAYLFGSMPLEDAGRYMAYAFAFGGIKSVPGIVTMDKLMTMYLGHSVLNATLANPIYNRLLTGIPGYLFGVDVSSRHNWWGSLTDRFLNLSQPAFLNVAEKIAGAYGKALKDPTPVNGWRLFSAVMPDSAQAMLKAKEASLLSAVVSARYNPIMRDPNAQELAQMFLGFTPSSVSARQANLESGFTAKQQAEARAAAYEDNYKRALLLGDPKEIAKAATLAQKAGLTGRQLQYARQEVFRAPSYNMIRRIPLFIRRPFLRYNVTYNR